jgi:hypothetical protein
MQPIITPTQTDRALVQLTDAEILNPFPVITDLFRRYTLPELRELLTLLGDVVLQKDFTFKDPGNKTAFIRAMTAIDKALQADYVIAKVTSQIPVFSE